MKTNKTVPPAVTLRQFQAAREMESRYLGEPSTIDPVVRALGHFYAGLTLLNQYAPALHRTAVQTLHELDGADPTQPGSA